MTRVAREFSRFATTYAEYNIIQKKVADRLVSILPQKTYSTILDVGCGRGEVYRNLKKKNIRFDHFTAMDISSEMLALHPDDERLQRVQGNFCDPESLAPILREHYDLVLSASALQWSSDLEVTISMLSNLSESLYFAIFTSGTFRSLHQCAGTDSPIYTEEILKEQIEKYYDATFQSVQYRLNFDSVYEMLRYIKKSGVNGGAQRLRYTQTKALLKRYPYNYLEFEVLFVSPRAK